MRLLTAGDFIGKDTPKLARFLLGKVLVKGEKRVIITETEAYDGFFDKASHAHRGKTKRNEVMFGEGFRWYVYLVYGIYNMLNLVTGPVDYPAAILIRGGREVKTGETLNGPGKLTKYLDIGRGYNGKEAKKETGLWLEDRDIKIKPKQIIATPRIGISYASAEWREKPWRFVLKNIDKK